MERPPIAARPPFNLEERTAQFPVLAALRERVLVFDGAMGTMIQRAALTPEDFGGKDGCNEYLCQTRPDVVEGIHEAYLRAGADIVETNSFGSTPLVLAEYDLHHLSFELSRKAAELARRAALRLSTPERPRWVSGAVGPTTKLVSLGHISFDDLYSHFVTQMHGLLVGGADLLQIETTQDLLGIKCAVLAAREAMRRAERQVPIIAQVTIETTGTMLVGTEIAAALPALEALDVEVVGLNCATGPDLMQEHARFLGQHASRWVSVLPNAGLPRNVNGVATYDLTPDDLARYQERFVREFGVSLVGGCCGTTPEHIGRLSDMAARLHREGVRPRRRPAPGPAQVTSLYTSVGLTQDPAPLLVGERSNANGSKKFRDLLAQDDWDGLVEMGREQVAEGAHVLDVCVAYVGRDESADMDQVLRRYTTQVTLPLMIDTTQIDVLEAALKRCGGRSIINSVNLEDGEEKADAICRLAREYGAALVALTIDEEGMAKTADRKVAVARRIYDIACRRWGLPPDALLFDPLTFTIGSGDEASRDAGIQTLQGIQRIKRELPGVRTLLGLSNISFGLKPYPRQVLNSVFMAEAIAAGLDAAIVHAAKIMPLSRLSEADVTLARDLIHDRRDPARNYDPLFAFMQRFSVGEGHKATAPVESGPIEDRLKARIIDGKKLGIDRLLDEAMAAGRRPLEIINQVLLEGMKVVGELFGTGQMQLPFVLQSAETMKAAVSYLQPFMEKVSGNEKGVVVLATVKGDVHDIGKNLVDIILSNNGYRVVNLGIKQPVDTILQAAEHEKADAIGMSGLLVKSTVVMKENLEIMTSRGISIPVLCGGAALNRSYVDGQLQAAYKTGEVYYGSDAFTGLRLMDELCGHTPAGERVLTGPGRKRHAGQAAAQALVRAEKEARVEEAARAYAPSDVRPAPHVPRAPFYGTRVVGARELDLRQIFQHINRKVLFRGQWQYRRGRRSEEEYRHFVSEVVEPKFHEWCQRVLDHGLLQPQAVYGYFPCYSEENSLVVLRAPQMTEWLRFTFPRQPVGRRLCLSDYFRKQADGPDVVAFTLVTMGQRPSEVAAEFFQKDQYEDYLHFHGLAVESAEALAEVMHKRVRHELGYAAHDEPLVEHLLNQGYQGSRYSFGYPACPRLEDHVPLFELLQPERIGVSLSEEFQLVPEQSTSALITHHPEARYFSITGV